MLFTPKWTGLGNRCLNNAEFLKVYYRYESRLSERAKELCEDTVLVDDDGDWIVQSDFDMLGKPTGFGTTIEEASIDFMEQLLEVL